MTDQPTQLEECRAELRTANFYRDKLAERLYMVETVVVELRSALSCDPAYDPDHWRLHVESALSIAERATRTVKRVA